MRGAWSVAAACLALLTAQCGQAGDDEDAPPGSQPTAGMSAAPPMTAAGSGITGQAGVAGSVMQPAQPSMPTTGGNSGATAGASGSAAGVSGASGSTGTAGGAGSEPVQPMPEAGSGPEPNPMGPRFPSVTDLKGKGPYTAVTKENTGPGGAYTLYHPMQLAPDGLKNPIITWGNGATTFPALYALLPHLASHGFVVIAANNSFVTGAELRSGIDWLLMENKRMGSELFQKLDESKVASMGYSLGSLGTFEIADDPRLTTTLHISGGAMNKSVLPKLKKIAAFLCGDPSDIAHDNCESDFEMVPGPVFYGVFPGDHFGVLGSHAEQIGEASTGWLRWQLMGDDSLAKMFQGPDCTLCKDARWTVKRKGL